MTLRSLTFTVDKSRAAEFINCGIGGSVPLVLCDPTLVNPESYVVLSSLVSFDKIASTCNYTLEVEYDDAVLADPTVGLSECVVQCYFCESCLSKYIQYIVGIQNVSPDAGNCFELRPNGFYTPCVTTDFDIPAYAVVFGNPSGDGSLSDDVTDFFYNPTTNNLVVGPNNTVAGVGNILGGRLNTFSGSGPDYNAVVGQGNGLIDDSLQNVVAGIDNILTDSSHNLVVGNTNSLTSTTDNVVGGDSNTITGSSGSTVGGSQNTIIGAGNVVAGRLNILSSAGSGPDFNLVVGQGNTLAENSLNNLIAGTDNVSTLVTHSSIVGFTNIVTGFAQNVSGQNNTVTGFNNIVAGNTNEVVDNGNNYGSNLLIGTTNIIDADNSVVSGISNAVNDCVNSTITGFFHAVTGDSLFATGANNEVTNRNTTCNVLTGRYNTIDGSFATTLGTHNKANSNNQVVQGSNAVTQGTTRNLIPGAFTSSDSMHIWGNGLSDGGGTALTPHNAHSLRWDGIHQYYTVTADQTSNANAIAALAALGGTNLAVGALAMNTVNGLPVWFKYSGATWSLAF